MKSVAILAILGYLTTEAQAVQQYYPGVRFVDQQESFVQADASEDLQQFLSAPCDPALPMTAEQMKIEMDYFSRKFDMKHYNNAMKIFAELKKKGYKGPNPKVTSWELYDKSFAWPRVRQYPTVEEAMNVLEHFEDNLNMNISNSVLVKNFITNAKVVQKKLNDKYHNGEFKDPALVDPQADE